MLTGRWPVQRIATSTGSAVGGIHHPLKPPSTSWGAAEVAVGRGRRPGVVEALAEHEPAAVGTAVDRDVAARAALRRDRGRRTAVGARRRPVRCGEHDAVDVEAGPRSGRGRDAVGTGGEVDRRVVAQLGVERFAGQRVGDRAAHLHGDRGPVDGEQVVRQPVSNVAGTDRAGTGGDLADRRRQRDRFGVAPVERRAGVDAGDGDPHGARPGPPSGSVTVLVPVPSGGATVASTATPPPSTRSEVIGEKSPAGWVSVNDVSGASVVTVQLGADRLAERCDPRRRRIVVGRGPARGRGDAGEAGRGQRSGDARAAERGCRRPPAGRAGR